MKMTKSVEKMNKTELVKFISVNLKAVSDLEESTSKQDLLSVVKTTDKLLREDKKKVSQKDLVAIAQAVISMVPEDKLTVPEDVPVENSTKKTLKKSTDKESAKTPATPPENKEKAEKAKKDVQASSVEVREGKGSQPDTIESFAKEITVDNTKYVLAEEITDMKTLHDAMVDDAEAYILAFAWTKRLLRQFGYFNELLEYPETFPQDLDICTLVYISDEMRVAYAVSTYTEAFYTIMPKEIEVIDGLRISNGIEYQIYKKVQ